MKYRNNLHVDSTIITALSTAVASIATARTFLAVNADIPPDGDYNTSNITTTTSAHNVGNSYSLVGFVNIGASIGVFTILTDFSSIFQVNLLLLLVLLMPKYA